ncbi:Glycine cleavage T-protein (Aminomethyl transferase) [Burkholderiales bacterium]|jgi:aminomethyltransferase|nr:Glycine cleavage T-protein (Aminomethyl transferase) [Burkholderiales bacterium]
MLAQSNLRPHYRRPLLTTPFFERSQYLVETDTYVPWSGYTTPDVFSSVEQEYFAIRNSASVFDLTPMVKYRIVGPDAQRYLNRLITRDVSKLKVNRVAYTVWCNEFGHLIDDGTVFRFGPNEFHLCTAERQLDWFLDSAIGFEVEIREVTDQIAALSLQGPTSCAVLKAMGLSGIENLKLFEMGHYRLGELPLMVSRTGFTGDLGYELWIATEGALDLWDRLMAAGHTRGIRAIGYQALEMARIEAGFVLPNVDFISAARTIRLNRETTPFELGLEWLVALEKGHFNGRRALVEEKARGSRRRLLGIEIAGKKPAHGSLLYDGEKGLRQVGEIKSALWSPTCKRNIALAMIEAPYFSTLKEFWVDIYVHRELLWERRMERAWPVERPFFAPERRKATPAPDR